MIKIRSFYSDWHEVSEESAKNFVKNMLKGMTARGNHEKIINNNYLRGITCTELLKDKESNNE